MHPKEVVTMKAMVLTGIRQMALSEVPDARLRNADDVMIRMGAVGVCGSDIHYYVSGRIGNQVVRYPFIVGHECAGTVSAVGSAVRWLTRGDRVAIEPAISCGHCDQCRQGREHTCRNLLFLGCPGQIEGCLAEFLVMPERCCFKLKEATTLAQGAISEPLSIGVYAVKQSIAMAGAKVGILGLGPIGLSVMLPALAQGAAAVYGTDKISERLALARKAGATWTGNPETQDVVGEIQAAEPAGLDVVFECCGEQEAVDQALEILKPGGKLMLIGIPGFERFSFSVDKLRRKEICIQNVRRQVRCVQPALDLIEERRIDADPMITHRFPFAKTKEAFDLVEAYADGVVKAMIEFD